MLEPEVPSLPGCVRPSHDGSVTTVVLFGGVVSLIGVTIWLGLLIWAAKGDGRVQREHEEDARRGRRPPR